MSSLLVSGYHPTGAALHLNSANAALELAPDSALALGGNPSYACFSPDRRFLFAVDEGADGRVSSFAVVRSAETGALQCTRINSVSSGGADPCHIVYFAPASVLYVSNYSSGTLVGIRVDAATGALGEHICRLNPGKNAHQAVIDSAGPFLFAPFLGSDRVFQYTIDAATGQLSANPNAASARVTGAGAGPRHMAFHPSYSHAYVLNELNGTISTFAYDRARGVLGESEAQTPLSTVPADAAWRPKEWSTAHVAVSADGRFAYASNRGHNSIVVFSVDPATHWLQRDDDARSWALDVDTPRDFCLSPDVRSRVLVAACQGDSQLVVFHRDADTGRLTRASNLRLAPGSKPTFVDFWSLGDL